MKLHLTTLLRVCLLMLGLNLVSSWVKVSGQNLRLTANYTNATITDIVADLEQQYDLRFFYKPTWLPDATLALQFENQPLNTVMDNLLQGSDLSYIIYDGDKVVIAPVKLIGQPASPDLTNRAPTATQLDDRFQIISVGNTNQSSTGLNEVTVTFKDNLEDKVLDGVSVYFDKLQRTFSSNRQGVINMSLPTGVYQMEARRIGYDPFICHLQVNSDGEVTIPMNVEVVELREVVVSGDNPGKRLLDPQVGIVSITPKQIKEMPVFLGEADVIKTILTVPGVTSIGEGSSGFFVRGGNIDQNLILQDGAIFSNSSHALGFFSLFNPDLISNVKLYKGNIPAQFGGRLSSVLDVQLKGNDYTNTNLTGGVGTVLSKLAVETPIVKDKISILAGGRISYADWLLPIVKVPEIRDSESFFYDFNVKLSARLSEQSSLQVGYFQSFDRINFQGEAGFEWTTKTLNLNWNQSLGKNLRSELTAATGQTENLTFDPSGLSLAELNNGLEFYKVKESLVLPLSNHLLVGGVEWIYHRPQDEVLSVTGSTTETDQVIKDFGQEWGFYLNDEWEATDKLAVSLGVRASMFSYEERGTSNLQDRFTNIEPRVSLRYTLNPSTSVKFSYNRLSQYIHLLSNTTGVLPNDQWIVSNSQINPAISNNYSAGLFKNFSGNSWESSAEVFYRQLTDVIEFVDFANLILNPDLESELVQGEGEAYGLELFLKKHTGAVTGNLSYTLSRTQIRVPSGIEGVQQDWFPAKFDRPHNLNLVANWTASKKSRFSMVFNLSSGRPITAPISAYALGDVVVSNYSARNEFRIPTYHRLDLSYTYKRNAVKKKRYQDSITFSIYNIYGRKNAFSVFFRKQDNRPVQAFRLSVLGSAFPSITYTFEFK